MHLSKFIAFAIIISTSTMSTHNYSADEPKSKLSAKELISRSNVKGALNAIDAWIEGNRIYDQIPGISVGIVYNEELVWSKGYGYANLESLHPADTNTLYSVCSISKVFTAIGIMMRTFFNRHTP